MSIPHRIVLVHKGALGDFLQVWPSLFALSLWWSEKSLAWAGRQDFEPWIAPLGISRCHPAELKAVNQLYSADTWPEPLERVQVIWFGLRQPPTSLGFNRLWFLPGLETEGWRPPRDVYAERLAERGCQPAQDWLTVWRRLFSSAPPRRRGSPRALIFPGAGHPAKCWPLQSFKSLAGRLASQGVRISFVLGPVELERGFEVKNFEQICPRHLPELQSVIERSDLVIGNDSGPLHLSALMGIPSLALFGPTSWRQWGPLGAKVLSTGLECAPCSRLGRIECLDWQCLKELDIDRVAEAAETMLASVRTTWDKSQD